jgi:cytochrome c
VKNISRLCRKVWIGFGFFCAASPAWNQSFDPHPFAGSNALDKVHPGWDLANLLSENASDLPTGFSAHIGGMAFLPNGKLVIADFPDPSRGPWKGSVWILDGVQSGDKNQVKFKVFADNLYGPSGITIVDGVVYVIDAKSLKRLTDKDSNGTAEVVEVTHAWNQTGGQPAVLDLVQQNGFFYTNVGSSGGLALDGVPIAGGTAKIGMDGKVQMLSTGLRNPNGIAINTAGDLFATDNQGEWLPSNKLIHIVTNRYYGFQPSNRNNQIESPPAVWIPQGIANAPNGDASKYAAGLSPSSPLPIESGLFAGQLLLGDIRYGNIHRICLEKIQGEYQGALFHFAGGFRAGINRMVWGPDGALYLGGMGGNGYTWSWKDNDVNDDWGLQRIKPNGKAVFEIQSVHAVLGGFELKFTQALDPKAAAPANFKVQTWRYLSTGNYGGPQVDMKSLPVKSVQTFTDKTKLFLEIPGLVEKNVVHIELDSNAVISSLGAKPWTFETWYTLNRLSTVSPVFSGHESPSLQDNHHQTRSFNGGYFSIRTGTSGQYQICNLRGIILEEGSRDRLSQK